MKSNPSPLAWVGSSHQYYNTNKEIGLGHHEISPEIYNLSTDNFEPFPPGSTIDLFKQKETNDKFKIKRINKGCLTYIIDCYIEKIQKNYNTMIKPFYDNLNKSDFFKSAIPGFDSDDNNINYRFDFTKITNEEQTQLFHILESVLFKSFEWKNKNFLPFNLNKENTISNSMQYDYAIFELVYIYKSFDWDQDIMTYYIC